VQCRAMPRPRLEGCVAGVECRAETEVRWKEINNVGARSEEGIFWGVGDCEGKDVWSRRGQGWTHAHFTRGKSVLSIQTARANGRRDGRREMHRSLSTSKADLDCSLRRTHSLVTYFYQRPGSYIALSKVPCASTHSQTARLAWPWPTTSTHPLVLPPAALFANNNIYPTHGASCSTHYAASRLDHCTNLRNRGCHCRYCATVGCSVVALQAAGGRGPGRGRGHGRGQGEVGSSKSNLQPPISLGSRQACC
jgi:hypothetical protein